MRANSALLRRASDGPEESKGTRFERSAMKNKTYSTHFEC